MRRIAIAASSCTLMSLAAFAGPFDRGVVGPGAGWTLHVDVEAAVSSSMGKYMLAHPEQFHLDNLDQLKAFGIDALTDLKGITIFGAGKEQEQGVVVIDATAAVDKLWNQVKTEPNAKTMTVEGVEMISWDDHGERKYGVVKQTKGGQGRLVYIAEDWAPLAAAVNGAGKAQAPADIPGPGAGSMIYAEASVIPEQFKDNDDPNASAVLKALRSGWFDMGERDKTVYASLSANFSDAKTATDMSQVVTGILAFGRMAVGQNPQAADLSKAISGIKVETKEKGLTIAAAWPSEDAIKALTEAAKMDEGDDDDDDKDAKDDKDNDDKAE